ncbi:hypothetical protein ICU_04689 [Bacillus cereus BAG2X1-1]|nr:hypothetical protein ICU_04689 [Bacillus cereus BAG2X1-1]
MSFILTTSEAMEVMNINRSRLNVLVKDGRIIPLEQTKNMRLFLKSDAEQLGKELAVLRKNIVHLNKGIYIFHKGKPFYYRERLNYTTLVANSF